MGWGGAPGSAVFLLARDARGATVRGRPLWLLLLAFALSAFSIGMSLASAVLD
jgi:hypothetical protein